MVIRVDLECAKGHRKNNVYLESGTDVTIEYPRCSFQLGIDNREDPIICGLPTEQVFDGREESEGYWVMRGVNW